MPSDPETAPRIPAFLRYNPDSRLQRLADRHPAAFAFAPILPLAGILLAGVVLS